MKSIRTFKDFKKINESTFKVGDHYNVKSVFEIPESLVNDYIEKVKSESSKDPLQYFTKAEIAEQIVKFLVEENLDVDQIPSSIIVGESDAAVTDNSLNDEEDVKDDLESSDDTPEDEESELEFEETSDEEETDTNISDDELDF